MTMTGESIRGPLAAPGSETTMSITPLSGQSPYTTQPSSNESVWQSVLTSVSNTLGVSTTSLQQEFSMGQSLNSIGAAQGVPRDTLLKAIETGLQSNSKLSGASSAQIDKIAAQIANRTVGGHAHGHGHDHHHGGGVDAPSGSATASSTSAGTPAVDTYA
jgi:hypothetical protein